MIWLRQFWIDLGFIQDETVISAEQRQRDAGARLGIETRGLRICDYNAAIMNRIADLEERLEAHEKASKGP